MEDTGKNSKKQEKVKKQEETGRKGKAIPNIRKDPQRSPIIQSPNPLTDQQTDRQTDTEGTDKQKSRQTNKQELGYLDLGLGKNVYFCTFPNLLCPCPGLRSSVAVW